MTNPLKTFESCEESEIIIRPEMTNEYSKYLDQTTEVCP
jgi:hypothetical protein